MELEHKIKNIIFLLYFTLLITAFILSLCYSYNLLIISLIFAIAGSIYNIKPFRFKDLPILDVNHCPHQLYEVLILVSFLLYKYNIRNSIEILIKTFGNYCGQLLKPIFLFEIIRNFKYYF